MIRSFLPRLLATITNHPRERVSIEWSKGSWTHNVFRLYEFVFGRRSGIRAEMTMQKMPGGRPVYYCHTFESACALTEQYIREWVATFKFVPFRIYVPVLQTSQGIKIPASPYLFAIAFDTALATLQVASSTSFTTTGSNRLLAVYNLSQTTGSAMTATYNSVSMAQIDTIVNDGIASEDLASFILNNPASGSHTIAATGGAVIGIMAASYSGVKQSNTPDNHTTATGSSSAASISLTPVAANCWMIGYARTNSSFTSAGAGTTDRCSPVAGSDAIDSNATVSGSTSLNMNLVSATWAMLAITIAPPTPVANGNFLSFM